MAVFSNDPTVQSAWQRAESARRLVGTKCDPFVDKYTNVCRDEEMQRRLGWAACNRTDKVKQDCPDYAALSRAADKALKDAQQAIADQNRKNKLKEAEQRLEKKKGDLLTDVKKACAVRLGIGGMNDQGAWNTCIGESARKDSRLTNQPTFAEVEREAGFSGSGSSTKKPAKLKKKAKAAKKAAAKLKKKNR
jgi:hypothetical protein